MTDSAPELALYPEVVDSSGYTLSPGDFDFLGIDSDSAWACADRASPLGIPEAEYASFVASLFEALDRESLDDVDVRIQGSSATFFSSTAKKFPETKEERAELFIREQGRLWRLRESNEIEYLVGRQWPSKTPGQRPFDSMYKVGLSPDASDIDVQISSDSAFRIAREIARRRNIDPQDLKFRNAAYNFMIKEISDVEFLYLQRWAAEWQGALGRTVSIALFEKKGPPKQKKGLSSHFRKKDWMLAEPEDLFNG